MSYQNISQRLYELQGLQLPLITQPPVSAIPAYQPVSAVAGGVGGYNSNDPMQGYSLPPMGNAKSRGDLTSIDQLLEQMQAAIYENDSQLAQAGVAQPGAHYVNYRTSTSPPAVQLQSAHAQSTPMMNQQQQHHHNPSIASATDSVHSSTPALTPPSSAQSYTSGHSPVSHNMTSLQGPTSGGNAMYPSLPTGTMDNGYTNNTSAPNASTLGGLYDGDEHRRRYSGGLLQRAQPGPRPSSGEAMEVGSDGSATPPAAVQNAKSAASARKRRGPAARQAAAAENNSVIDPALSGMGPESATAAAAAVAAAAALKSPAGSNASEGQMTERDAEKERAWVDNMRLIEWMREYVKKRLEEGDFDEDVNVNGENAQGATTANSVDVNASMNNIVEQLRQEAGKDVEMGEGESENKGDGNEKGEGQGAGELYPTLKGVGN